MVSKMAEERSGERIASVLDIGCGRKGVIAQNFWESVHGIEQGYACDRHVIKELPEVWTPLLMDAEELLEKLGPKSVDFVTHCGLLEHLEYDKALRILRVIEQVARLGVFFTCSAIYREVDYKVKHDGNPYHYYRSFWDAKTMEALGYTIDRERMDLKLTFQEEVTGWYFPDELSDHEARFKAAQKSITERRCAEDGCNLEPMMWDCHQLDDCWCATHSLEHTSSREIVNRWLKAKGKDFSRPPWRAPMKFL